MDGGLGLFPRRLAWRGSLAAGRVSCAPRRRKQLSTGTLQPRRLCAGAPAATAARVLVSWHRTPATSLPCWMEGATTHHLAHTQIRAWESELSLAAWSHSEPAGARWRDTTGASDGPEAPRGTCRVRVHMSGARKAVRAHSMAVRKGDKRHTPVGDGAGRNKNSAKGLRWVGGSSDKPVPCESVVGAMGRQAHSGGIGSARMQWDATARTPR